MYSVIVCTTDDRELPAPEYGLGINWDRLTDILRREVSPEAADLLAEPIPDSARGQTHWHTTANDDPISLSTLSTPERDALLEKLDQRGQEILRFADRLVAGGREADQRLAAVMRSITEVPDRERHIWSVDGKPVITAWGRRPLDAPERVATIVIRERARTEGPAALSGTVVGSAPPPRIEAGPPPPPVPPELPTERPPDMPPWWHAAWARTLPLWVALALLLLAIFTTLLPACSISLPLLNRLFNRCELQASTSLDQLREKNRVLRDALRQAELRVAIVDGDCATRGRLPPSNRAENEQRPNADEALDRARREHATEGKLDVTLAWNGREDLDIHVYCPGGAEIWAENRKACGGELEIDKNAKADQREDHPLEHVTWVTDPPPGEYQVLVRLYNRFELPERDIPFTVVVRANGSAPQEYKGIARDVNKMVSVTRFTR
jgi:hypothetical protein